MNYYNEFDAKAATWLNELILDGQIAYGIVDTRSITEVSHNDLKGFTQHHFFAGIGGWSYALRLAEWSDTRPAWTASLPCQPFSAAGKGLGKADERHLLPHFLELVAKCKPDVIFGEQVERAIAHGWLDDLQANMEAEGYAVGHCVLGAHSISAPHIRQRLYWVADSSRTRYKEQPGIARIPRETDDYDSWKNFAGSGRLGDTEHDGCIASTNKGGDGASIQNCEAWQNSASQFKGTISSPSLSWIYCRDNKYRPVKPGIQPLVDGVSRGMGYSGNPNNTQEARTMRLKGYGNAIVPQVAAKFILTYSLITG